MHIFIATSIIFVSASIFSASACGCEQNQNFERFAFDVLDNRSLARVNKPVDEREAIAIFGKPRKRMAVLIAEKGHWSDLPEWEIALEYSWGEVLIFASAKESPCNRCAIKGISVKSNEIMLAAGVKLGMRREQVLRVLGNPQPDPDIPGGNAYTVCQTLKADGVTYGGYATVSLFVDGEQAVGEIGWSFSGD